jgi:hypothetical protein
MTDFKIVTAYTIFPLETIEAARAKMIHRGVRMLLVVDDQNHILGLITSSDLTSEKPMQVVQTQGIRHSDVMVKDIMTPREKLEVLCMEDLQKACVGDIVHTLKSHGRQHALVVERDGRSQPDPARHVLGVPDQPPVGRPPGNRRRGPHLRRTGRRAGQINGDGEPGRPLRLAARRYRAVGARRAALEAGAQAGCRGSALCRFHDAGAGIE